MDALPKVRSADTLPEFSIASFKQVDDDRFVAEVQIGFVLCGSIYLTDCQSATPRVIWPRTVRGYPIIVVDEPLRAVIEVALRALLTGGGI